MDTLSFVPTLEGAIDDYLHTMVRVRPWAKRSAEETFERLLTWLLEQQPMLLVVDLTWQVIEAYAQATDLKPDELADLRGTVTDFARWLVFNNMLVDHPLLG